jgi:hypothetical protein
VTVGTLGVGDKKLFIFTGAPALRLATVEISAEEFSGGFGTLATAVLKLSKGMSSPEVRDGINIF